MSTTELTALYGATTPESRELNIRRPLLRDGTRSFKLFNTRKSKRAPLPGKRSRLYELLNGRTTWFNRLLLLTIGSNVVFDVIITVPRISKDWAKEFDAFETLSSVFFLIEYVLRLNVAGERAKYAGVIGRIRYALTIPALIDAVSFLPWLVEKIARSFGNSTAVPATAFVRIFRVLRILKTERFIGSVDAISRVIQMNGSILMVGLMMAAMLLLLTSSLLYYANRGTADPQFESIPATMYVALLMLTGQGEPDGELTEVTKVLCAFTAVFSVAIVAIPASMLTFGFEIEATRLAKKRRESRLRRRARLDLNDLSIPTSSESESDERIQRRRTRQRQRRRLLDLAKFRASHDSEDDLPKPRSTSSRRRSVCCPRCGLFVPSTSDVDDDDDILLRRPDGTFVSAHYPEQLDSSEEEYEELVLGKSEADAYQEIKASLRRRRLPSPTSPQDPLHSHHRLDGDDDDDDGSPVVRLQPPRMLLRGLHNDIERQR